ncbi:MULTISPECIES: helix-turn-helix domain-containing protein [Rodentibacter]|uniref:helix-turn-helix domain-containing protein n=1 Tax=Rodentibacter TaxID=1960084 RepID=UPI0010944911|nr:MULTISPECIES: helix-turn-helix transcriptional regulator [Pasteurellaceae]MCR1838319.1 helix-turn-helix domain-containing protein [Pasteurella caecimuris]MCU0107570.1 helix-turn-helix domain-containing protein [Pasteurella caecimuris]NBH76253.1 XRE family transcriptional regulator [Rodentibacter pneumotropicus]TGY49603.1 XRE family transcriptional regulator [Pasteurella caecimuris]THA07164.1 XRE family transcriptional regulator [Rodentibacter pneumotropicus]
MSTIGNRLKNERERLGLSQTQLGAIGGVQKQSQLKYENGATYPNANYLNEVSKVGIDILYVVLGTRANTTINEEEQLLLHKFRNADPAVRKFMLYGGEAVIGQNFEGEITGGQFGIINHYKE